MLTVILAPRKPPWDSASNRHIHQVYFQLLTLSHCPKAPRGFRRWDKSLNAPLAILLGFAISKTKTQPACGQRNLLLFIPSTMPSRLPSTLRVIPALCLFLILVSSIPAGAEKPVLAQDQGYVALLQELQRLRTTARLMQVTAHPDDEDGGMLTLESRGRGASALLCSLTRGEGGQNKSGDAFSDELGVLRTLELLAATDYYGIDLRFTRVADFGF